MATVQISLPAPHDAQRRVLAEAKRFNVLSCGRRWGKSTIGIDRIVKPALEGFPTAWFSPSYKMLLESWREIQDVLAPVIVSRSNAEFRIELRGGGSVVMFSLAGEVAESVRGRAFKCIVIDEAALVRNLRDLWETAIRATLADYRGDGWMLSTPRGFNGFKLFYDRGQDPEREDCSWQMPTGHESSTSIRRRSKRRASDMTAGAFNQKIPSAVRLVREGAVFRRVRGGNAQPHWRCPEAGHELCDRRGLGPEQRLHGVHGGRYDGTLAMVAIWIGRIRVDYVVQRGRLQALYERWRLRSMIIAEANSIGQPIIEELQRSGLPVQAFTTTSASKADIIENLALAFEQRNIAILPDPVLLGELQAFAAEQLPSGSLRYSAPSGQHDDCVISLGLAWNVIRPTPGSAIYAHAGDALYSDLERPVVFGPSTRFSQTLACRFIFRRIRYSPHGMFQRPRRDLVPL